MDQSNAQRNLQIIKDMIDKTRREAAENGHAFIFMGLASIIFVIVIMAIERLNGHQFVVPAMIGMTVLMGIIGYLIIGKPAKKEKVKSYPKTVFQISQNVVLLLLCYAVPFIATK